MVRSATFRSVTGYIAEFTFFLALRACVRWSGGCEEKSAVTAFPESKIAFGTDISGKFTISGVAAVGAFKFVLFIFHFLYLRYAFCIFVSLKSLNRIIKHQNDLSITKEFPFL